MQAKNLIKNSDYSMHESVKDHLLYVAIATCTAEMPVFITAN